MKYLFKIITILCAVILFAAGCADRNAPGASPSPQIAGTATAAPQESPQQKDVELPESVKDGSSKIKVYLAADEEIKEMTVNDYLYGVVAGEVKNDWPQEALNAQAIIARTFMLEFLSSKKSKYEGADISTDVAESQAYNPENINDAIKAAVDSTDGQVLLYEGSLIKAWFHSCSGGITASAMEGLGNKDEPGYIKIVESDESAAPEEVAAWSHVFTREDLEAALAKMEEDVSEFDTVKVTEEGPSGRAVKIAFGDAEVSAVALRTALGPEVFRSTLIDEFNYADGKLTISGKGFGHGVGMSQWGANKMAEEGKTAPDIINFYFNSVELVQAWGGGQS